MAMITNRIATNLPVPAGREAMSARDVVFVLYRRRLIILAVALPIILVGGIGLLGRTEERTAAARIVVEFLNVERPQWNVASRVPDYDRELSTLANIAMSVSVVDRAVVALQDSLPVIRTLDPNLAELNNNVDVRDFLMAGFDVNVVGESNILEFRYTDKSPRLALMAVGALRNAFVHHEDYGGRDRGAVAYYQEQVSFVKADIDSLLRVRGEILGQSGYTSLEDELRYQTGAAAQLEEDLRKVQVDRQQLESEYNILKGFLDRDPREFPSGVDENRASTLVGWRDLVGKQEDSLNSILSVYTDDSLPARRQRALLERSLDRLREEEVAYTESIRVSLVTTQQRERTIEAQLAAIRGGNQSLPGVYQRVSMLDSEIKSLRDLLDDLQGKLGEVRMSEMADNRVSKLVVLSNPELVTVLGGGKSTIYFVMLSILGVALGVVGAYLAEAGDHRIGRVRDVEEKLQLPVLATVSRSE